MKKHLLPLLALCIAAPVFAQEEGPIFHPINEKRPQKTYFKSEVQRLPIRSMADLLKFTASEFDLPSKNPIAVLLNGDFVGQTTVAGNFIQLVDDKKLLEVPLDSVRMALAEFDPNFQTRHADGNFFGKINVLTNPTKLPDTVPWNRFEPERFLVNRNLFKVKRQDYDELAAISARAGWFLGTVTNIQSIQAGAWLEVPLTRRAVVQAEFSYTNMRDLLGKAVQTPFEDFTYVLSEWKGRADFKYYLKSRYQRPYLLAGAFVGRASGQIQGGKDFTPAEFLAKKTGFGCRVGIGMQFLAGLYGSVSVSPYLTKRGELLPFQQQRGLHITVGWMIGPA